VLEAAPASHATTTPDGRRSYQSAAGVSVGCFLCSSASGSGRQNAGSSRMGCMPQWYQCCGSMGMSWGRLGSEASMKMVNNASEVIGVLYSHKPCQCFP